MEINFPVFTGDLSIQWSAEVTIKTLKKKKDKKKDKGGCQTEGKDGILHGSDKLHASGPTY